MIKNYPFGHKHLKTLNVFFLGIRVSGYVLGYVLACPGKGTIEFFCPAPYPGPILITLLRGEPLNASFQKTLVFSRTCTFLPLAGDEKNFCL